MRCVRVTAMWPLAAALFILPASANAGLLVNVSKSQQRVAVIVDGTELYRWPVSTGRRGYATPTGTFHPTRLERHWYSHEFYRSPMPWAVFFHRGYALHGTMEAYHLGHAASHGCVRLRPDNASILYSLVRREGMDNTKIVVMEGPLPAAPHAPQVPRAVPGSVPMSDSGSPPAHSAADDFAKALPDDKALPGDKIAAAAPRRIAAPTQELQADTRHADAPRARADADMHVDIYRMPRADAHRVSRGDDAKVLRDRDAWLTALAHKYGYNKW